MWRGVVRPPGTMKTKFTYAGIRVKDLDASVGFYTKVLGMKDLGRSTIDAAKGVAANLASEDDGFVLELNYYEKGSRFATDYVVGEGLDHLAFQVENLDKALAVPENTVYVYISWAVPSFGLKYGGSHAPSSW